MKRILFVTAIALGLTGLTACASSSPPSPSASESVEAEQPALQEGIPGADRIKLRYERLQAGGNAFLYCVDSVAYLHLYGAMAPAPQYDSLCKSER